MTTTKAKTNAPDNAIMSILKKVKNTHLKQLQQEKQGLKIQVLGHMWTVGCCFILNHTQAIVTQFIFNMLAVGYCQTSTMVADSVQHHKDTVS